MSRSRKSRSRSRTRTSKTETKQTHYFRPLVPSDIPPVNDAAREQAIAEYEAEPGRMPVQKILIQQARSGKPFKLYVRKRGAQYDPERPTDEDAEIDDQTDISMRKDLQNIQFHHLYTVDDGVEDRYYMFVGRYYPPKNGPMPSEGIFTEPRYTAFFKKHKIPLYAFTGDRKALMDHHFSDGNMGMLFSFPERKDALLKIRAPYSKYENRRLFDTLDAVYATAHALVAANKCAHTNRILGVVYFPTFVKDTHTAGKWGYLLERVPNAMGLGEFVNLPENAKRRVELESSLRQQAFDVADCLFTHGVSVDTMGHDNILVDAKTERVWFIDIGGVTDRSELSPSTIMEQRKEFHEKIKRYLDQIFRAR